MGVRLCALHCDWAWSYLLQFLESILDVSEHPFGNRVALVLWAVGGRGQGLEKGVSYISDGSRRVLDLFLSRRDSWRRGDPRGWVPADFIPESLWAVSLCKLLQLVGG